MLVGSSQGLVDSAVVADDMFSGAVAVEVLLESSVV